MAHCRAGLLLVSSAPEHNWSGAVRFIPAALHVPDHEDAAAAVVAQAAAAGRKVRVVGSRHSFVPFWNDDDVILDLRKLRGIVAVDAAAARVEIRAGTVIADLGAPLWDAGFALANMGDIDRQALAGAISTGTHGTGGNLGSLPTRVSGVALIDGSGRVHEIGVRPGAAADGARDPRLDGIAVAMGSLGVLTRITLDVLPRYGLHERQWQMAVDDCLATLTDHCRATRHFEFFFTPRDGVCHCKSLAVVAPPPQAVPVPELPFGVAAERVGASFRIFPSVRERKFNEMEYSVPAVNGPACFQALQRLLRSDFPGVAWPLEYRTVAADRLWLSPNHARASVTISLHEAAERDPGAFFRAAEQVFLDFGGRPHWGKQHFLDAARLAARYPRWDDFQALRQTLDAPRTFANAYMARLLGP